MVQKTELTGINQSINSVKYKNRDNYLIVYISPPLNTPFAMRMAFFSFSGYDKVEFPSLTIILPHKKGCVLCETKPQHGLCNGSGLSL
jgi:hypothetical protein